MNQISFGGTGANLGYVHLNTPLTQAHQPLQALLEPDADDASSDDDDSEAVIEQR